MENNNRKKGRPKTNMQIHAVVFLRICLFSAFLLAFWCPFFENVCFSLLFDFLKCSYLCCLRTLLFCFVLVFYSKVKPARKNLNGAHTQNHSKRTYEHAIIKEGHLKPANMHKLTATRNFWFKLTSQAFWWRQGKQLFLHVFTRPAL